MVFIVFKLCPVFFLDRSDKKVYLLALDEVVEAKSGKSTDGLGRFFSSLAGRPIYSVCYHVISLIEVSSRKSFVINSEQQHPKRGSGEARNDEPQSKEKSSAKRKAGRPKGSKDKTNTKEYTRLSKSFEFLLNLALSSLATIGIAPSYVVADGAYSSKTYILICIEKGVSIISKIGKNCSIYFPAEERIGKFRGRPRKYGEKVNLDNLETSSKYFHKTLAEKGSNVAIDVYHFPEMWVQFLPVKINIVVLITKNKRTEKISRKILFSTDLALAPDLVLEYYSLRFQIEFNFRDAKQYFGLSDFKSYRPTQVANSVGLAFFMVNFSHIVRKKMMELWEVETLSVLDVKAGFRVEKSIDLILNCLDLDVSELKKQLDIRDLASVEAINLTEKY